MGIDNFQTEKKTIKLFSKGLSYCIIEELNNNYREKG